MTLAALKARLQDLVSASPLLAGRPVLLEDKGNLVSELETVLQTQSLAVVIALASGQVKDGALRRRALWVETFEVVIHRGPLDGADVPATDTVLEDLRARLHGAPLDPAGTAEGAFACLRHDLRDGGDGTYARVLTVALESSISSHP